MSSSSARAAFICALLVAPSAEAGPLEELVQVALHPSNPNRMVVRYRYSGEGLFYSDDAGKTWRLLCGQAIEASFASAGPIAMTDDGTVLMGVFDGLWEGVAGGCIWTKVPLFEGIWVSDVEIDPTNPSAAFAVTGANTAGAMNGVARRDPSGSWSQLGSTDDVMILGLRAVATASGVRLYEDALRGLGMPLLSPVMRVSDDQGQSWTEFPVDTGDASPTQGSLRLEGVDPSNPDRIVGAFIRADANDTVLVSNDRGQTFTEYLTITDFGGIAFAPDGRVWIADQGSIDPTAPTGLWYAASLDAPATRLNDLAVRGLGYGVGETLYACQRSEFGSIDVQNGAFQSLFTLNDLAEFVSCPGVDMAATCKSQLCLGYCGPGHFAVAPICCAYDDQYCGPKLVDPSQVRCESDAGVPDASVTKPPQKDAGVAPRTTKNASDGGCACTTPARSKDAPLSCALLAGLLATVVLRRRVTSKCSSRR